MDLNSILNTGVDPSTGKYMSPGERKESFRKSMGMGYASATKKGSTRPPIKPGSALVRRDKAEQERVKKESALVKQQNNKLISKLDLLTKLANNLFQMRSERVRLEQKYAETKRKVEERERRKSEEQSMESSGGKFGSKFLDKVGNKAAKAVGFGLFDLLKGVLSYGILNWISKPENKEAVEMMVKGFMGLFKVFSFFVSTAVNATLGGFTKLFGGGSILERIFGFFEMIGGIFLFRRVLNPLKLIGDLKWVIKNLGNFRDIFKALRGKNLAKAGDAVKKLFPKAASLFKKGIQGSVQRIFLKIFGKGITKFIKPIAKTVVKTVVRPLAGVIKRVPVIGTLLAIPINMFLGDPIDKAIVKAIGATLGTFVVGALGSIIPGAGTVLGGIAGGLLGDWLAGWLYDGVIAPLGKTIQKSMPQLNTGGIASGPDEGYKVTLHGTEAVIPIDKLSSTILEPYKTVASAVIGGTLAVLKSMGPIGALMGPVALQMFNPFIRIFGFTASTFVSGLGKGSELLIPSAQAREFPDVPASKEEMVEKTKKGGGKGENKQDDSGDVDSSGIEAASGSVVDKGVSIAKKFMSNLGLTKQAAAAIAGNFAHESGGFIPGIREGGPFGKSSKPWPKGTVGRGYGWAQWTNSVPGDRYDKFIQSYGGDYNKIPTNEDNFKFAVQEMRTTNKLTDNFKNMTDTAKATVWFRKNWERAGVHHDEPRISYAKGILEKMSEGGVVPFRMSGGNVKVDTGFHRRERSQVVETGLYRAKTLKEKKYKQYASGGVHRTIPDTSSTSWAAGIPLTYVRSKEGKTAEVAVPLAKRFQGFITDLQSTGYKISELGGFRPDGPPAGNADGKGPQYAHPYGAAIDINWTKNPAFRKAGNDFPPNVKQIANKWGLGWGNAFDDAMHFSAMKREYGSGIDGQEISKKSLMGAKGGDYVPSSQDESPPTDSPASDKQTEEKVDSGFMGSGASIDQLKYLMANLGMTGGGGSGSAPTTPSAPPASSALPSMSSNFTLDKKMSAITSKISETVIVQQGSNNFSNISVSSLPLNTFISTTDVLNKL